MRLLPIVFTALTTCAIGIGQTQSISKFAGGRLPVNILGTSAGLNGPKSVAVDSTGSIFFTDYHDVLRLDAMTGLLTLVAGNGTFGFSGDNGPATSAQLYGPQGVALDASGNLYIADSGNNRIRKVANGVITTVAGNGTFGFSGDNGPATSAQISQPWSVAVDTAGDLYFSDEASVRKVANGVITTVAGNGVQGFGGDNGPAFDAQLLHPMGIAVDTAGALYIADYGNNRIRKVANGVITTVAGDGTQGDGGNNGPAIIAQFDGPGAVAVDATGNLYIADVYRIRKIANGVISTVAGNGLSDFRGDNGPGTSAAFFAGGVTVDAAGNLYIVDLGNRRIRKVADGVITTVAGNGGGQVTTGSGADLLNSAPAAPRAYWINGFYLPYWSSVAGQTASDIPWQKYTQVTAGIMGACNTNDGTICPGWGHPTQSEIDAFLAARPAGKKALISIGDRSIGDGVTGGQSTWDMDTSSGAIDTFVRNMADVVNQTGRGNGGFDGVDIDWENPDATGQTQFPALLAKLRAALPGKIVTMDAGDWNSLPNIAAAAQVSLDQVNVMCFDMDGSNQSWYNSALYNGNSGRESCSLRVGRIISAGVAPAKVSVGIPFYTRQWTGCTRALFTPCTQVKAENYRDLVTDPARWRPQYQKYDSTYKSDYLSIPRNSAGQPEFDSFNGSQSIQDVVAWGKAQGFGGFFNYSFDSEYISSRPGDARYPLSSALAQAVGR